MTEGCYWLCNDPSLYTNTTLTQQYISTFLKDAGSNTSIKGLVFLGILHMKWRLVKMQKLNVKK